MSLTEALHEDYLTIFNDSYCHTWHFPLINGPLAHFVKPFWDRFVILCSWIAIARDKRDKRAFFSIILKLLLIMAVVAVLVLIAAAILGEWALTLVFGARIAPYSYLLIPILISIFTCVICSFLSTVLVVLRDFAPILVACGVGVLAETLLTAPLIEWCGTNGTSYSFIFGSLIATVILTVRLLFITRHGIPKQPQKEIDQ